MARLARAEIFDPAEIVAVHLIGKTVRSCYLMGVDGKDRQVPGTCRSHLSVMGPPNFALPP